MNIIQQFPTDIWLEICLNLSVKSLYMLRATCTDLRRIVDDRSVWASVFVDLLRVKPSAYTMEDVEQMTALQLRQASRRTVYVDQAFSCPEGTPYRETRILGSAELSMHNHLILLPGGHRALVVKLDSSFDIYDIATSNVVLSSTPTEGPERRKSIAHLHPTSINTGYIVIKTRAARKTYHEFRVYHYTPQELRHVWSIQLRDIRKEYGEKFVFCQQKDALLLAELTHLSGTLWEVRIDTLNKDGHVGQEILKFRLDSELEEDSQRISDVGMLSPRYLCYRLGSEFYIVDLYRARSSQDPPIVLLPIWKSPDELSGDEGSFWFASACVSTTLDGEPYVRDLCMNVLSSSHERLYILELPALRDVMDPVRDIHLAPFPSTDAEPITTRPFMNFNHGLLFQSEADSFGIDQLYTFSLAHCPSSTASDANFPPAGLLRLGRSVTQPEVLYPGYFQGFNRLHYLRVTFSRLPLEDISGRCVQMTPSDIVLLYTLEHE